jgi:hypothetical protein
VLVDVARSGLAAFDQEATRFMSNPDASASNQAIPRGTQPTRLRGAALLSAGSVLDDHLEHPSAGVG